MTKQDAIQKAGSPQALADLLKISRPAISQWGETIPQARIWQLMALRPEWFRPEPEKNR
jgi:DNA-binding transcriptional regulator YdaS (Cro superfamily)